MAACALDRLLLIPNRVPPHKQSATTASFAQRLAMVRAAVAGDPRLEASGIEDRDGKSYTIETLERLRASYGPGVAFYFVIGADAFAEVMTWYRVADVFRMTDFIVAARPGFAYEVPVGARVHPLEGVDYPESSTAIRERLAAGLPVEELPAAVADYIEEHGLYRGERVTVS